MLQATRQLKAWGADPGAAPTGATYYDMIARDKEVVKLVLLLTGSIEGTTCHPATPWVTRSIGLTCNLVAMESCVAVAQLALWSSSNL